MPRKNADKTTGPAGAEGSLDQQVRRIADLLALLLVKGESQPEKIRVLSAAGYANAEIAALLGVTANAVTVSLYQQRKRK